MKTPRTAGAALLLLLLAVPIAANTVADSYDEWSTTGTQGEKGWWNGYYNLTTDSNHIYAASDFAAFLNDGTATISSTNHWNGTWLEVKNSFNL